MTCKCYVPIHYIMDYQEALCHSYNLDDEQLSQVDVDKVDQVVEQLQVEGNTVEQTASNSQGKWGYVIDLEWEA